MTADETLNELLVKLFKDIMEIEGKSLITDEFKDLTYNDFHVIRGDWYIRAKEHEYGSKADERNDRNADKGDGRSDPIKDMLSGSAVSRISVLSGCA